MVIYDNLGKAFWRAAREVKSCRRQQKIALFLILGCLTPWQGLFYSPDSAQAVQLQGGGGTVLVLSPGLATGQVVPGCKRVSEVLVGQFRHCDEGSSSDARISTRHASGDRVSFVFSSAQGEAGGADRVMGGAVDAEALDNVLPGPLVAEGIEKREPRRAGAATRSVASRRAYSGALEGG